ncbi:tetratricopeptide repeat protein 9C-like [Mytilus edulis]|uniref:tetratricopeptide repeat protein 9C-like n=1 Tax=Mytilus edulis TaxID=6550 RepID=UPI0039F0B840
MESSEKPKLVSDKEKIETAERFKKEGNEQYKAKNYKVAIGKYHRAIIQLKAVGQNRNIGNLMGLSADSTDIPTEVKDRTNTLKADCYNNLAACMLQQEEPSYEKIVEHCNNVLEASKGNVKALYRKGVACYHLKNYEEALEYLQQSKQNDTLTRKYLTLCKHGIAKQEQELRTAYKKMFTQPT